MAEHPLPRLRLTAPASAGDTPHGTPPPYPAARLPRGGGQALGPALCPAAGAPAARAGNRGGERRQGASPSSSTCCCAEEKARTRGDSSAPGGRKRGRFVQHLREESLSPGERGARGAPSQAAAVTRGSAPGPAGVSLPRGGGGERGRRHSPHSRRLGGSHSLRRPPPVRPSTRPSGRPAGWSGAGEAARPPAAGGRLLGSAGQRPSPQCPGGSGRSDPGRTRGEQRPRSATRPHAGRGGRGGGGGGGGRDAPLAPAPPPRPPPGSPRFRAPPGGAAPLLKGAAPGVAGGEAGRGARGRAAAGDLRRRRRERRVSPGRSHLPRGPGEGDLNHVAEFAAAGREPIMGRARGEGCLEEQFDECPAFPLLLGQHGGPTELLLTLAVQPASPVEGQPEATAMEE
ncbi:collagen alpha-1(I) chain-like [Falco naumanni]|uniref:collagen alpha-1(I) chain-like n=1 Tax=Falco naumanni TaxID=148594 RepID=UPI001ADE9019|nr:collagen alpha-1(I) chain-like [Falco naumanni]